MSEEMKVCPILSASGSRDFLYCLEYRCKWYIHGECVLYWLAEKAYWETEKADIAEDEDML
jgi:hypothetical protein